MKYLLNGLESERISFELLQESDFDWWMEFASNSLATKYFGFLGTHNPEEFCRTWFSRVFDRYLNDTGGHNVLIEKSSGLKVGMCGLLVQEMDGKQELEIGYSLHPGFWGKGFATEAARKCRDHAFGNNFADSLISIVHIENQASANVALRNGMNIEKTTVFKDNPVNVFRVYNR